MNKFSSFKEALLTKDSIVIVLCHIWIPMVSGYMTYKTITIPKFLGLFLMFVVFVNVMAALFYLVLLSINNNILRGILLINVSIHFFLFTFSINVGAFYSIGRNFLIAGSNEILVYCTFFPFILFFAIITVRYFTKGYKCLFNK